VISGGEYELTAETAMPCQVNYVSREPLMDLLQRYGEAGLRSAQALSREFQAVYRDVHDLILARSSAGRLAKLLLSWTPPSANGKEVRVSSGLTHEEMAQMIGASRETVTSVAQRSAEEATDSVGRFDAGDSKPHGNGGDGLLTSLTAGAGSSPLPAPLHFGVIPFPVCSSGIAPKNGNLARPSASWE